MGLTNSYKATGIDKDLAARELSDNIANKGFEI